MGDAPLVLDISIDTGNVTEGIYNVLAKLRPEWNQQEIEIKVTSTLCGRAKMSILMAPSITRLSRWLQIKTYLFIKTSSFINVFIDKDVFIYKDLVYFWFSEFSM